MSIPVVLRKTRGGETLIIEKWQETVGKVEGAELR